jgi:hypothetical protein
MRISMKIVFVLVFLNSAAELLRVSGWATSAGINPDPGATSEMQQALDAAGEIRPGGGFGETLFALYISLTKTFFAIFEFVFSAPQMLINLGLPTYLVAFLFAPAALVVGRDVAYLLMGRTA